eukprot:982909-Pyramimonas_sp.AAC.1
MASTRPTRSPRRPKNSPRGPSRGPQQPNIAACLQENVHFGITPFPSWQHPIRPEEPPRSSQQDP